MPATLQETLLAPDTQPKVIDDCHALLQQQVSDGSGISGTTVKLAYKTVNTVFPGHIRHMVDVGLPGNGRRTRAVAGTRSAGGSPGSAWTCAPGTRDRSGSTWCRRSTCTCRGRARGLHDRLAAAERPGGTLLVVATITATARQGPDQAAGQARSRRLARPQVGALVQKYAL